ncbi:hypothetical protein SAY86_020223 [Trapa natans]|uniref:Uncharacterized protein n=1 Tax=Trapa natans TaxID=22666 RepID=A0AAN7LPG2_TRANT|nr:hypothetical protein SAY86_020223 [Trapa natans]
MRRTRGSGGRFTKKSEANTSDDLAEEDTGSGPTLSSQSLCSSGSKPLTMGSPGTWNSSSNHMLRGTVETFNYSHMNQSRPWRLHRPVLQFSGSEVKEQPYSST